MLTFFRRIRKRLLEGGSTSKYLLYAIGEIALVVIGILLALQINNWNQRRIEKNKEIIYLSALKSNLEDSQEELDRVINKTKRVETTAINLLNLANNIDDFSDLEMDSMLISTMGYTIFMTSESTIRELISSGNLNLIQNEAIRSFIASWDSDLKPLRGWEVHSKDEVEELINLVDEVGEIYNFELKLSPLLTPPQRKIFLTTPKSRNTLHGISKYSIILNELYQEKKSEIESMLQIIDASLRLLNK